MGGHVGSRTRRGTWEDSGPNRQGWACAGSWRPSSFPCHVSAEMGSVDRLEGLGETPFHTTALLLGPLSERSSWGREHCWCPEGGHGQESYLWQVLTRSAGTRGQSVHCLPGGASQRAGLSAQAGVSSVFLLQ